ncbi:MAG: hypothetical protein HC817_00635 [Saprospiraceae bacterium]|nr:hypothetical protein [Saprospiraceae bacterium]
MKKIVFAILYCIFGFFSQISAQSTAAAEVDTLAFMPYVGKYESPYGKIKVWIENKQLFGELEGQGAAELLLTDTPDELKINGMEGKVVFTRNDEKKIAKLKISVSANGSLQEIEGERVE